MDYLQIIRDSFRILRTNKLVWLLGFISYISSSGIPSFKTTLIPLSIIILFVSLITIFVGFIADGSLIYTIHQANSDQKPGLSEAWGIGKKNIFRMLGLYILWVPFVLIIFFINRFLSSEGYPSLVRWLFYLLILNLFGTLVVFGLCAIIIHKVNIRLAILITFQIAIKNFFGVLVITLGIALFRLMVWGLLITILALGPFGTGLPTSFSLDFSTFEKILATPIGYWSNWGITLISYPLQAVILTLAYMKLTEKDSYKALLPKQTTA